MALTKQELLDRIKPCDLDKPYIFISYSSQDYESVFNDVIRFQEMGYNIWLDDKCLDKTKPSWKDSALEAIKAYNCYMLAFFVSEHSLTSQPCFNEVVETMSQYVIDTHFDQIQIICIDVDVIDNIVTEAKRIAGKIRTSDLDQKTKSSRTQVLSNFMKTIFNNNNERVRTHSKNFPGRNVDYYAEITQSFPPEAKINAPVARSSAPKVEEKPVVRAEEKPVVKAEEKPAVKAEDKPAAKPTADKQTSSAAGKPAGASKATPDERKEALPPKTDEFYKALTAIKCEKQSVISDIVKRALKIRTDARNAYEAGLRAEKVAEDVTDKIATKKQSAPEQMDWRPTEDEFFAGIDKDSIIRETYSSGTEYIGQKDLGNRDGKGMIFFTSGNWYFGDFDLGTYGGQGTFYYAKSGARYEGGFSEDKRHGAGTYWYKSGARYDGEYEADQMCGAGIYIAADGFKYAGEFDKGTYDGYGVAYYTSGNKFAGLFRNGKRVIGVMEYKSGSLYAGEYQPDGKMKGLGYYQTPIGKSYLGEFENDTYDGEGIFHYADNEFYVGTFKAGKRAEEGEYHYPSGKIFNGTYVDDYSEGEAVMVYPDGSKLFGNASKGNFSGECTYYACKDGLKLGEYTGEVKNTKYYGWGKFKFANGVTYEGSFKAGVPHGHGTLTIPAGVTFQGKKYTEERVYDGDFIKGRHADIELILPGPF